MSDEGDVVRGLREALRVAQAENAALRRERDDAEHRRREAIAELQVEHARRLQAQDLAEAAVEVAAGTARQHNGVIHALQSQLDALKRR